MRAWPHLAAIALAVTLCGCSAVVTTWDVRPAPIPSMHVFVMPAMSEGTPATGNAGRDFRQVEHLVTDRILAIVHERDSSAAVTEASPATVFQPMATYVAAMAPTRVAREEIEAAGFARAHQATHLLVPMIIEWRQMRTDDPIGALVGPHDGLTIGLRLVQVDTPVVAGRVTFRNNSHITANQPAERLLGDSFRKTVLQLLGS
jgi:hypothetical protein